MGICSSLSEENEVDKRVERDLQHSRQVDKHIKKLLLLGAGSSGKTTFFKQLKRIHGVGFTHKDRLDYRAQIYSQIIEQMQKIIQRGQELMEDWPDNDEFKKLKIGEQSEEAAEFIDYLRREADVNEEVARNIDILWHDPGIRATFDMRAKLAIPDSCSHFFNDVTRIGAQNYMPTDTDILLVRKRTTGIIEENFTIKNTNFHIFDVGGQRNERKKWIHCFESVTAVIFVASLSSYNEVLLEDENVNVMEETLNLFEEICNSRWFVSTSFILFLNKRDLFEEKLTVTRVPLTECTCFSNYRGSQEIDECLAYIRSVFESRNRQNGKTLFTHITQATDKANVQRVFDDVQHIVIQHSLHKGGLM